MEMIMGTELLEVGETFGRGYKRALALARRAVKNTLVEPEDLIMAMFRRMVEKKTLVHVVAGNTTTFLDVLDSSPESGEGTMVITVPMPQKDGLMVLREAEWDVLRAFVDMIEYERAAPDMPVAQYAELDVKRLMAGGFRFWALTRTVGWKHPIGVKTPKTAAQHKIVRKPRKVHEPVVKGGMPPLARRSLFVTTKD